jgi:hypothetical protein
MEVHHHPHLPHGKKKFKEYLLEFLMIFLAVTLGFFAESYREYSVEKSRAKQYAGSLIHDLEKDTAMVGVDIRNMAYINARIDSLSYLLKRNKISSLTNVQLFAYTHFGCEYRPYTWSRASLDEIKSSGSLRYFDSDSIIMKISAYDALTKHLDEDFRGDAAHNDRVSQKKNRIVDGNYGLADSLITWRTNPDSIIRIVLQNRSLNSQPDLVPLTGDANEIKSLMNDYLDVRNNLYVRSKLELPHLISEASELILLLKKTYHL